MSSHLSESYADRYQKSQVQLRALRKEFYARVREERRVVVKCRPFELHGYVRDGVEFEPEQTLILIYDPKVKGQLFNEEDKEITVYSSFEEGCLADHLRQHKYVDCSCGKEGCRCPENEYIGLQIERIDDGKHITIRGKGEEEIFTDLVLSWGCDIFEDYLYQCEGVLVVESEVKRVYRRE